MDAALALLTWRSGSPVSARRVDVLLLVDDVWLRFHSQLSRGERCERCGLDSTLL